MFSLCDKLSKLIKVCTAKQSVWCNESMQSFVQYKQTFSWDFWLQTQKIGIHNEKHSYLADNPCPSESAIIQLYWMKLEERFSLHLSCVHLHVTFNVLFVTVWYWTGRPVVYRRLKWMVLSFECIFNRHISRGTGCEASDVIHLIYK